MSNKDLDEEFNDLKFQDNNVEDLNNLPLQLILSWARGQMNHPVRSFGRYSQDMSILLNKIFYNEKYKNDVFVSELKKIYEKDKVIWAPYLKKQGHLRDQKISDDVPAEILDRTASSNGRGG